MKIISIPKLPKIPASHEDQRKPGVLKRIVYTYKDFIPGGRIQMINWAILPPKSNFRLHYHEDLEEVFIIIQGQVRLHLEGQTEILDMGDAILILPKSAHKMENISSEEVIYLVIGITKEGKGKTITLE
jgi:mannose-6-phosphate isomerase-like protein (cupin superfamily)